MPETYHVRVAKDYLVFSAAHFITFNGNVCERLHGHNYRVAAEVSGPVDENQYVVDFIALRDALKELVTELDHYVLLPTEHPAIRVTADAMSVEAVFEDRRWVFPRGDCVLLPVANTTAEMLARYLGQRLLPMLAERAKCRPQRLRIEVDECEGQLGVWELTNA
jgi:6-pyruvoyltetrahydropterin/6-carboxytetrahydropterin synthase